MATIINGDGVFTAGGTASTQGRVVLAEQTGNGTNTVTLQAPASLAADLTLTMPVADGTNGQVLQTNGSGALSFVNQTTPTSLASPLAVIGNATAGAELRLPEDTDNGSNYVALKAPDSLASNLSLTLPSADGTSGQVLQTNGSGALSFTTPAAGFSNMVVFTSSTTWSIPAGVTKCKVTVTGGGGGVNGSGLNGSTGASGAGGTAIKIVALSGGSATITIGSGGSGNSVGGNSSFVYSATTVTGDGGGSVSSGSNAGGSGGAASGGDINITGGSGSGAGGQSNSGGWPGTGGGSYWGGGGGRNQNGAAYGSGAGTITTSSTLTGAAGVIVIEY